MKCKTTKLPLIQETVLYVGDEERPYCAFPSILETEDKILCACKQGKSHMADEGITTWLLLEKNGAILQKGTMEIAGLNTQNAELLRLRDGTIVCWLDIQDYSQSKQRTGAVGYTYQHGAFVPEEGILTDTSGVLYGYVFDSLTWQERDWMLAMTFPELPYPSPRKTVSLLASEDGKAWEEKVRLDTLLDAHLNESSLVVLGDTLYIFCRGYDSLGYMMALAKDGQEIARRTYEEADGIFKTGRPKLFVRDGRLYGIMRNYCTADSSAMRLDLIRFDPVSLAAEEFYILDDAAPRDGYYAEPYFDGEDLCVITYKSLQEAPPAIVLLRYDWRKVTT